MKAGDRKLKRNITVVSIEKESGKEKEVIVRQFNEPNMAEIEATEIGISYLTYQPGGHVTYYRKDSDMGSYHFYSEFYAGSQDIIGELSKFRQNIGSFVDLLMDWLQSELGHEKGFDSFRASNISKIKRDAENACLYVWLEAHRLYSVKSFKNLIEHKNPDLDMRTISYYHDPCKDERFQVRMLHYALIKGYISQKGLSYISFGPDHSPADERIGRVLGNYLAKELGYASYPQDNPNFAFLSDNEAIQRSLDSFIEGTDEYKQALTEHINNGVDPHSICTGSEFLKYKISQFYQLFPEHDDINHRLENIREKPVSTNGIYDPKKKAVIWKNTHEISSIWHVPLNMYAVWSDVDKGYQEQHFGQVLVDRYCMIDYCQWYNSEDPKYVKQWKKFIGSLSPSQDIVSKLKSFTFKDDAGNTITKELPECVQEIIRMLEYKKDNRDETAQTFSDTCDGSNAK
jgi:hypothetical protein